MQIGPRLDHWRAVFGVPFRVLTTLFALLGIATFVRDNVLPPDRRAAFDTYTLLSQLPQWQAPTWFALSLLFVVVGVLEGSYRLSVQHPATDAPRLKVGELSRIEGNYRRFQYILSIRNESHVPADDVRLQLIDISPLPAGWGSPGPDFPYSVSAHPPEKDLRGQLVRGDTQRFELFLYYLYSTGLYDPITGEQAEFPAQLHVVGFRTHGPWAGTALQAHPGESWRLRYRVLCSNGEPQAATIEATVSELDIECELVKSS